MFDLCNTKYLFLPPTCNFTIVHRQRTQSSNTQTSFAHRHYDLLHKMATFNMEQPIDYGRGTYDTSGVMKPLQPFGPSRPPSISSPPVSVPSSPKSD